MLVLIVVALLFSKGQSQCYRYTKQRENLRVNLQPMKFRAIWLCENIVYFLHFFNIYVSFTFFFWFFNPPVLRGKDLGYPEFGQEVSKVWARIVPPRNRTQVHLNNSSVELINHSSSITCFVVLVLLVNKKKRDCWSKTIVLHFPHL